MNGKRPTPRRWGGPRPAWWQTAWIPVGLLSVAVWLTFARTAGNDLVFDDLDTIKHNRLIENVGNLKRVFSKEYFQSSAEYSYRPVVTLSYFFDHLIAGKRPWFYHLHNVVLHHLNVLLAFALFNLLGAGRWRAFAIALLFALHPLQSEAVIFPGFREDLQMTTGVLAMSCCLAADREQPAPGWVFLAMLALAYALFAKEGALLLPAAWLGFDAILNRRAQHRVTLAWRYVPLAVVLAGYVAIRFFVMANPDAAEMDVIDRLPLLRRILTAPYLFAYYVKCFLWPTPLCVIHNVEALQGTGSAFYVSVLVVIGLAGLWVALAWREPWLWLAGLWVGAAFAPVSNLYPIVNLWAERFYYSVNLGTSAIAVAAVGVGWGFLVERARESRRPLWVVVGWILVGLLAWWAAVCNTARILECNTSLSLWRATVQCAPWSGSALKTLAKYELDAGNYERAERFARESESRVGGGVYAANYILGQSALRQKDWGRAILHFEKAREAPPPSVRSQVSLLLALANAYLNDGQKARAAERAREALRWDPQGEAARRFLDRIEPKQGDDATTPSVANEESPPAP